MAQQELHFIPAGGAHYPPNGVQPYIGTEMIDDGEEIYVMESSMMGPMNAGHHQPEIYCQPYPPHPNDPQRNFMNP